MSTTRISPSIPSAKLRIYEFRAFISPRSFPEIVFWFKNIVHCSGNNRALAAKNVIPVVPFGDIFIAISSLECPVFCGIPQYRCPVLGTSNAEKDSSYYSD